MQQPQSQQRQPQQLLPHMPTHSQHGMNPTNMQNSQQQNMMQNIPMQMQQIHPQIQQQIQQQMQHQVHQNPMQQPPMQQQMQQIHPQIQQMLQQPMQQPMQQNLQPMLQQLQQAMQQMQQMQQIPMQSIPPPIQIPLQQQQHQQHQMQFQMQPQQQQRQMGQPMLPMQPMGHLSSQQNQLFMQFLGSQINPSPSELEVPTIQLDSIQGFLYLFRSAVLLHLRYCQSSLRSDRFRDGCEGTYEPNFTIGDVAIIIQFIKGTAKLLSLFY
jgi:hypothetical protein